jgi:putative tricarboxylic transport membrane protein
MTTHQSENDGGHVESAQQAGGAGDPEDEHDYSRGYLALVRLLFPTTLLILAILYVESTLGEIRTQNLYYPYFVIGLLVFFLGIVYAREIRRLLQVESDEKLTTSLRVAYNKWRRSIGLVVVGIAYIFLIEVIGFFPSTFVSMIAIMIVGGLRDPKLIVGVTSIVVALIYIMFVQGMGLAPPQGMFGI